MPGSDMTDVVAPDPALETLWVVRAAGAITVAAYLAIVMRAAPPEELARGTSLEAPFAELSVPDQLAIRQLLAALMEADALRSREGRWPEPARLGADAIPPFAAGPPAPSHSWELRKAGGAVNYLGIPRTPGATALLLFIEEPLPGGDPTHADPAALDADHRQLSDGTVVHATFWTKAPPVEPGVIGAPAAAAWRQVALQPS